MNARSAARFLCGASASLLVLIGSARSAPADDAKSACADDAERAQQLRDESKLLEAREAFVRCSQPSCPLAVRKECSPWLDELVRRIPTVVPSARDATGVDLEDVRLRVDGELRATTLAGAALPIDPGPHVLRFERPVGAASEIRVIVREGEQGRIVSVTFPDDTAAGAPPPAPPTVAASRPIPLVAYLTGSLAVVALGVGAYTGVSASIDYGNLEDRCAPDCAHDDVRGVRDRFTIAQISVGLGILAAAVTTVLVVTRPTRTSPVTHASW